VLRRTVDLAQQLTHVRGQAAIGAERIAQGASDRVGRAGALDEHAARRSGFRTRERQASHEGKNDRSGKLLLDIAALQHRIIAKVA
jgi:hypothetical protein